MMRPTLLFILVSLCSQVTLAQRSRALPDFVTAQHAGSIGYLSSGLGYDLSKRVSLSFHYGYVPKYRGGALNIVAGKILYNAYTFRISQDLTFGLFQPGLMISYHFGSEFRSRWPSHRYPEGYYWWKTSLRAHLLTQTSLTLALRDGKIRSVTGYVEFNTNELYLISYFKNHHSLSVTDIIKVGYGIRATF